MRYLILILILFVSGCAGKDETIAYYDAVEAQNLRLMTEKNTVESARLQAFNTAITAVADNPIAVMAITMVFSQPQPDKRVIMEIDDPDTFVDGIAAFTPILQTGLIAGFTAWGVSEVVSGLAAGTTYTLSDNSSLDINSDNDGSFNDNSGDITTTNSGDGDHNGDEGDIGSCSENPPGGFSDPSGTPMWSPTCTCADHDAGSC